MTLSLPTRPLSAVRGCLLGTAVGDALGLPYEGLSRRRLARWAPPRLGHALLPSGRGMVSDDTEHTVILARALSTTDSPAAFQRALARGLRRWLWCLPAGIGFGTLRALLKLSVGFGPGRSGVRSAGNGPAMRAALLGLCVSEDSLWDYVLASARLTHTDPRAAAGAWAVARAAQLLAGGAAPAGVAGRLARECPEPELRALLLRVAEGVRRGEDGTALAAALGLEAEVTGFVLHTVPVAVFLATTAPDFAAALEAAVRLGGDTDTVGAIVGALAGVRFGPDAIPGDWLDGLWDWPVDRARLEATAEALAAGAPTPGLPFLPQLLRNLLVFTPVVLTHALRRLLPPW